MKTATPSLLMSSGSALKHEALRLAMERAGLTVSVGGKKFASGVNEQPMSIEETYDGAKNRHKALLESGHATDYYVTVESGLHRVHEAHGVYGCTVVIIETAGGIKRVGFDIDIEFPSEWLNKVPSPYADMGVLVQQEYGADKKDPLVYLTDGRLTRQDVIERAAYNVIAQII